MNPTDNFRNTVLLGSETPLAVVYALEALVKITAMGGRCYRREYWNQLDFLVSFTGIIQVCVCVGVRPRAPHPSLCASPVRVHAGFARARTRAYRVTCCLCGAAVARCAFAGYLGSSSHLGGPHGHGQPLVFANLPRPAPAPLAQPL